MRFIHNSSFDPFPFIKPGLALCSDELYSLKNVMYVLEGEYRNISELGMDSNVELKGDAVGTVKEFFEWMFLEFIIPQAQAYLKEHRMEIFKTYYDLTKTMYLEKEQEFEELFVIGDKSISTEISKVKFIIHGTRRISDVKQEHSMFNEKMISISEHVDTDGSILKFKILQDPDTRKLHANWQREPGE